MFGWPLPDRIGALAVKSVLIECGYRENRALSYSADSMDCPLPLRSRSCKANNTPITALRPVVTSTIGTPTRVAVPSGSPLMLMMPPSACTAAS
ncbi:hypothetical protein D3C72_1684150 [compost metagenome]